jgi:hypothetical protein
MKSRSARFFSTAFWSSFMFKVSAGFSRKVGEPNYCSRGASVELQVELNESLIGDPERLLRQFHGLFALARHAVDQQLAAPAAGGNGQTAAPTGTNGNGPGPVNGPVVVRGGFAPAATPAQVALIRSLCQRLGFDPGRLAYEHYDATRVEELRRTEASALIDALQRQPQSLRRGNGPS